MDDLSSRYAHYQPYVADTEVSDPDDWRQPPAEAPADDEDDLEMQVTLDGGKTWCRVLLGAVDTTACDAVYRFSNTDRRPPKLVGNLCPKCFTPREIASALEASEKAKRDADAFVGINPRRHH